MGEEKETAAVVPVDEQGRPKPGIYSDVDFPEYRSWDCVNNSTLGECRRSAMHYKAALSKVRKETDALRFGTLAHHGRLEPMVVAEKYIVMPDLTGGITKADGKTPPDKPKSTKAYKERVAEFERVNEGKIIVPQDEFDKMLSLVTALTHDELAAKWLQAEGPAELSIVWDDPLTGLRCKGRVDKIPKLKIVLDGVEFHMFVDLKSTRDASYHGFRKSILNFGYARAGAFYADGLQALTGVPWVEGIVAVESESPFGVASAPLGLRSMEAGRREYQQALQLIAAGREHGHWPGYENPEVWEMPDFALGDDKADAVELSVGGQLVSI
ncbi:Exodeoxyribonuclease 8 [Symmachiella macrocystis]|uniref:Exodeoxyribonuclease 8 n=1 Tax=Symmachiella macrocystis TaxID=2527985 RepID=A0A5C6BNI7_9PLAN|nr:PD-(D/E)XK nuclease-like domain-containing protein [Symmachiella macrocystis]TWU12876.1 Exodeoxyribonuclease 8 [Symmachiella macrocystis]